MNQEQEENNPSIEVKPYTKQQLASMYGISNTTFLKWSRPFLEQLPGYDKRSILLTTAQVSHLFEKLGPPKYNKPIK